MYVIPKQTLCWDCKKAIGGCNWSNELKPVKGWTIETMEKNSSDGPYTGILVVDCPEFVRDATDHGLKRFK